MPLPLCCPRTSFVFDCGPEGTLLVLKDMPLTRELSSNPTKMLWSARVPTSNVKAGASVNH